MVEQKDRRVKQSAVSVAVNAVQFESCHEGVLMFGGSKPTQNGSAYVNRDAVAIARRDSVEMLNCASSSRAVQKNQEYINVYLSLWCGFPQQQIYPPSLPDSHQPMAC